MVNSIAANFHQSSSSIHHHELPHADEERLEELFNQLDRDGNGRIDVHDLSAALKDHGLSHQYAEVLSLWFN